jgi:AcrR family transcriptional regulator
MTPEELARDQRERLEAAMVSAVARHGYAGTTLRELAGLAGVSKTTFYEHFENKEDCLWATYETVTKAARENALAAFWEAEGQRNRLRAAFAAYVEWLEEAPGAASLAVIEPLCLGETGARHRRRTAERFEATLRDCFAEEPERGEASSLAVRGAIGGYRHVVYRCLRRDRPKQLRDSAEELADWMLCYQRRERDNLLPLSFFAEQEKMHRERSSAWDQEFALRSWAEPPDSRRSRRALTQRQRIVRALGRLACERGYQKVSVPAISGAAGVSNQTFYQEFSNKQEAFMAGFEELSEQALRAASEAFAAQAEWIRGVGAAITALVGFIAVEPYFSRLAFLELSASGPPGLDRADAMMDRFLAWLAPPALPAGVNPLPEAVVEAIGGGIWTVFETELSEGRAEQLPKLAPQLVDFALVPFA